MCRLCCPVGLQFGVVAALQDVAQNGQGYVRCLQLQWAVADVLALLPCPKMLVICCRCFEGAA